MARPFARSSRRTSARIRQTPAPSECTCVPSYKSQDGHVVAKHGAGVCNIKRAVLAATVSASGTQAVGHLGAGSLGGEGSLLAGRGPRRAVPLTDDDGRRGGCGSCQESPRSGCTQDSAEGASQLQPPRHLRKALLHPSHRKAAQSRDNHNDQALGGSWEATDQGHAKERPWQSQHVMTPWT